MLAIRAPTLGRLSRSPANKATAADRRLPFAGRQSFEQKSWSSFRRLRKLPVPQFQGLLDRLARHRKFGNLAFDGLKDQGPRCAYVLARRAARAPNAKKRRHLFERKPKPQGILNQAHSINRGFTVFTVAGGRTRGLGHEPNPLVVPDRVCTHARTLCKLAYPQPLIFHSAPLDAPEHKRLSQLIKIVLDLGIVTGSTLETCLTNRDDGP